MATALSHLKLLLPYRPPYPSQFVSGGNKFGARVLLNGASTARISNVMLEYCGQVGEGGSGFPSWSVCWYMMRSWLTGPDRFSIGRTFNRV